MNTQKFYPRTTTLTSGNSYLIPSAYAPATVKNILKCKKTNKNLARTYLYCMYTHQVSWITDLFCVLCKKDKEMPH
jgi:hypothetical protein